MASSAAVVPDIAIEPPVGGGLCAFCGRVCVCVPPNCVDETRFSFYFHSVFI